MDGVALFVYYWFEVTNEEHFENQTVKFVLTLPQDFEIFRNSLWLLSTLIFYVVARNTNDR